MSVHRTTFYAHFTDKQELLRMHWVVLAPYLSPEGRAMLERGE